MTVYAVPRYAIDISYLVADLKYSQEHGVKICEVQHGSLSALDGDVFLSEGAGIISSKIGDFFDLFPIQKWAAGLLYPPLKICLDAKGWEIEPSLQALLKNPAFLKYAAQRPADPCSVNSYSCIVYDDYDIARRFKFYCEDYPGVVFINAATFPYWEDKYKMNALFELNDELKQVKADWRLYPKKYDTHLAKRIQEEMPSELYVIKPRRGFLANGVIVVAHQDLDAILHSILEPFSELEQHPDKKYSYWCKNKDETFLIEKYYSSDYVRFSPPSDQNKMGERVYHYDATMRLAFILQYDGGKMTYHCLGAYWKLPSKAIEEEGPLNETRISCCKAPFYQAVDPQVFEMVNAHMGRTMLLLYEKMLHHCESS